MKLACANMMAQYVTSYWLLCYHSNYLCITGIYPFLWKKMSQWSNQSSKISRGQLGYLVTISSGPAVNLVALNSWASANFKHCDTSRQLVLAVTRERKELTFSMRLTMNLSVQNTVKPALT